MKNLGQNCPPDCKIDALLLLILLLLLLGQYSSRFSYYLGHVSDASPKMTSNQPMSNLYNLNLF